MRDNEPEPAEGICGACGEYTAEEIVRGLPRASGPEVRLIIHEAPASAGHSALPNLCGRPATALAPELPSAPA